VPGDPLEIAISTLHRPIKAIWILMDIEHRKTFVTGETFGHGVRFVWAQG
jgi:hypothetical protein